MVRRQMTYEAALAKAAGLCSRAEHAEAEMLRKLWQWGVDAGDAARVVTWLVDNGFVDNARYAHAFVYDKSRFDLWGRVKIRHHLRQNGVPAAVIEEAMAEIDDAEYASGLRTLLAAKRRTQSSADPYKVKASLLRYAASRGFEPALALRIMAEMVDGADDFMDDGDGLEVDD